MNGLVGASGRRGLFVLVLGLLLTLVSAAPAWAHATLIEATPSDTSVIAEPPTEVILSYDEAVGIDLGAVKVLAPAGGRVDSGEVTQSADGHAVTASLQPDLPNGTYTILWRVLSEDTHSIFGASTFSVGSPSATSAATAALAEQAGAGEVAGDLLDVARVLLYIGLVLLIGGLAFLLVLWPSGREVRGARRLLWTGWLLAAGATVAGLVLQGPYSAGLPLASALDPALLAEVIGTRFGYAGLARLILLAGFAVLLAGLRRLGRPLLASGGTVLAIGVLVSTSFVGHAGAGALVGAAVPADVIHLAAICGWLGGLVMLAAVVLRRPADLALLLPRWSRYAAALVLVVVLSGVFAAWREVREWGALTDTRYGQLLLIKIAVVAGMLALAGFGRWWIHRRLLRAARSGRPGPDQDAAPPPVPVSPPSGAGGVLTGTRTQTRVDTAPVPVRTLRISVLVETLLAVFVLCVTSVLVATPPAVETYAPVVTETAAVTDQLQVQMQVDPARAGLVTLRLTYTRGGVTPADVVKSTARWTRLDGDDVVPVELVRRGVGRYQIERVVLPAAGLWQLAVTTQTSDIDSHTTLFTVDIR